MALVMVKFQGGPLTGLKLPVDHAATEYRHVVHEDGTYDLEPHERRDRTTIHVYRRADWEHFTWQRREADEG
jgi:hypothetical protein